MRKLYKQIWAVTVSRSAVTPSLVASRYFKKNTKHVVVGKVDYALARFKHASRLWRLDHTIMNRIQSTRKRPQYYNAKKAIQKAQRVYAATLPLTPLEGDPE